MGTGVSFLLSPPYSFELLRSKLNIIFRKKPFQIASLWSSPRLISTGPLHSSQNFHSQPIYPDEPTGNLDVVTSDEIMKLLDYANKQGTTVLVVTHNLDIVQEMKKRTLTMSKGRIIKDIEQGGYFYED